MTSRCRSSERPIGCPTPSSSWRPTTSAASSGTRRRTKTRRKPRRLLSAVVAEVQRDPEVLLAQRSYRFLEIIARRRRDADLVALDGRLNFFQLLFLDVLHDLPGGVDRDALLDRINSADGSAGG